MNTATKTLIASVVVTLKIALAAVPAAAGSAAAVDAASVSGLDQGTGRVVEGTVSGLGLGGTR